MEPSACDGIGLLLSSLVARELQPGESSQIEAHLATCASCRAQAEALFRQDRALAELAAATEIDPLMARIRERLQTEPAPPTAPAATVSRIKRTRYRIQPRPRLHIGAWWGAGVAALLLIALGAWLVTRPRGDGSSVLARVEVVEGDVFVVTASGRASVQAGQAISLGHTLQTVGEESQASVVFADGTRLDVCGDTILTEISDSRETGKKVQLAEGFLSADVAKQPEGRPMRLVTPQAELVVLGTKFNLSGGSEVTYVETSEGAVHVTRRSDGQSIQVDPGFEAAIGEPAAPLAPQSLPRSAQAPRLVLEGYWSAVLSPDGKTLAATRYLGGDVELWDVATGRLQTTIPAHDKRVHAVAFSPDGRTLATGSQDETVKLWDRASGTLQGQLDVQDGWVIHVAYSADGKSLAVLSAEEETEDRSLTSWDVSTNAPRFKARHLSAHHWIASPDGRLLAAEQREDHTITLWNMGSGARQNVFQRIVKNVFSMAFSQDGATLAVDESSGQVTLWDVATGVVRDKFARHGGRIYGMSFSPDNSLLATGHQDGTVRVWDLATQTQRAVLEGPPGHTRVMAFGRDGKTLLTRTIRLATQETRRDGTVQLWDVPVTAIERQPK